MPSQKKIYIYENLFLKHEENKHERNQPVQKEKQGDVERPASRPLQQST